ncbi:pentatricopeptide repeat-containing protein At5g66520 [Jatropha curcas]|nr:pentatricopeptide repeat-containing protein At5g66520 [Jatropha curcas]
MPKILLSISNSPILALLKKCKTMTELKQIHAHIITNGLARFTFITSKVLAFCAKSQSGDINYARAIFNQIPIPNAFEFNSLIMGFSQNTQPQMGLSLFAYMRSKGIEPNSHTFTTLVKCCVCLSSLNQVYGQAVKFGHKFDLYVISSVINAYSKFGAMELARQVFDENVRINIVCWTSLISGYCSNGMVNEARKLFDEMPTRNEVSVSAMVSGYVWNGYFNEAIRLFQELKNCCAVRFSGSLLVSVLNACAATGAFEDGKWIHSCVEMNGFDYEIELSTALIDFYAKCGQIKNAVEVFSKMPFKDVTTWSAMILGLAINGENERGIKLFEEMEKKGLTPNAVTFIGVLTACNHKILVSEAFRLFGRMGKVYGIAPLIEHYGCMVDLLARAELIKEAMILIKLMPMKPDGAIWSSLLNGCLIHGHVEMAEKVGKHLIQLEPQHSGRYVLLANMYATKGNWDEVISLRKIMKERGMATVSAWSSIELDGIVHKFFVDDKTYSFSSIHKSLNQLHEQFEYCSTVDDA